MNSIAPGPILTENIRPRYESDLRLRAQFDSTPALARTGYPIDVAYAGLFLASDEALYITGANLPVDGGKTCKSGPMVNRLAEAYSSRSMFKRADDVLDVGRAEAEREGAGEYVKSVICGAAVLYDSLPS